MKRFLDWLFGPRRQREGDALSEEAASTSRTNAIDIAAREAHSRGHAWFGQVEASLLSRRGRPCWAVNAPANMRGYNVSVLIDDATGQVVNVHVLPR